MIGSALVRSSVFGFRFPLPFFNLLPPGPISPTTSLAIITVSPLPHTPEKIFTQPDAPDNPTPSHTSQPLHPITGVEYVRLVGYDWSFYPRGIPHTCIRISQYICPGKFLKDSYRPALGLPHYPRQLSEVGRPWFTDAPRSYRTFITSPTG